MVTISGPYCLVCGGHNVVRHRVWDVAAWTEEGPRYGWVDRDICLDCQRKDAVETGMPIGTELHTTTEGKR